VVQPGFPGGQPGLVQPGFTPGQPGIVQPGFPGGQPGFVQPGFGQPGFPGGRVPGAGGRNGGLVPGAGGGVVPGPGGVVVPGPGGVVVPGNGVPGVGVQPQPYVPARPRRGTQPPADTQPPPVSQPVAPITTPAASGVENTAAIVGGVLITADSLRVADDPLVFGSVFRNTVPIPDPRVRPLQRDRYATANLTTISQPAPGAPAAVGPPAAPGVGVPMAVPAGAGAKSSVVQQVQQGK
jgi:hypothetical protein